MKTDYLVNRVPDNLTDGSDVDRWNPPLRPFILL